MAFVKVAQVNDLKKGEAKTVEVEGKQIALVRKDEEFFALDNTCCHRGGPLGEGSLEGDILVCPWHGWGYHIKTGVSLVNPEAKVSVFLVKVEGKDVFVDIEAKV